MTQISCTRVRCTVYGVRCAVVNQGDTHTQIYWQSVNDNDYIRVPVRYRYVFQLGRIPKRCTSTNVRAILEKRLLTSLTSSQKSHVSIKYICSHLSFDFKTNRDMIVCADCRHVRVSQFKDKYEVLIDCKDTTHIYKHRVRWKGYCRTRSVGASLSFTTGRKLFENISVENVCGPLWTRPSSHEYTRSIFGWTPSC